MVSGRSLHVLVVDDDPHMREIAKIALELDAHTTVSTCDSGEDALVAAPRLKPDMILLDLMMPRVDGVATMKRLREHEALAAVPVVFCSAAVQEDEIQRLLALGAADVIVKPFDFHNLRHLVRQIWEKSRG